MEHGWHMLGPRWLHFRYDEVSSTSTTTFGSWIPQFPTVGRRCLSRRTRQLWDSLQSRKGRYTKLYPILYLKKRMQLERQKEERSERIKETQQIPRWVYKKPMCYQNDNRKPLYHLPAGPPTFTCCSKWPAKVFQPPYQSMSLRRESSSLLFIFEFFGVSLFSVPGDARVKFIFCWFPLKFNFVLHFHLGSIPWASLWWR